MLNTSVEVVHAVILAEGYCGSSQEVETVANPGWMHENSENLSASTYPSVLGSPTKDSVLQMLLRLLVVCVCV